jgi:hypothetical protein
MIDKKYNLENLKKLLPLSPLLFLYVILIFFSNTVEFKVGEIRYWTFSENLLNGFYALSDMKPGFLWHGPGYPILLILFTKLKSSLLIPRLFNGLLYFLGNILFYSAIKNYLPNRKAIILTYLMALYDPHFYFAISRILAEVSSNFLISCVFFLFSKYHLTNKNKYLISIALIIGYLILVKPIFAYVIILALLFFYLFSFSNKKFIKIFKFSLLSYVVVIPYLIYTYNLTGKIFYFSDAGGSTLYSMSSPFQNEYGDWFSPELNSYKQMIKENHDYEKGKNDLNQLIVNHGPFLDSLKGFSGLERDLALKRRAIIQIKSNKIKYLENIMYNFSRLFFKTPYTYFSQKTSFHTINLFRSALIFSCLIIAFCLFIIYLKDDFFVKFLWILLISFIGIQSLLSAGGRMLFPLLPIIWGIIGYTFYQIKVTFK